ncbi:maltose 6'-phosphate phosphatase [Nitrosomonas sp. Nm51]|uniref:endonuclease/exonuclease/phosphatase family protein n=1 Tax=Nitrosomonas sp. Nm51 TaxID=133720 RepID=UPI0008BD672E|nr:endonuclease/exonuclease/phosphatase family protein [Nitrosomonas sp. Nm51]SER34751.1 maltose 6'-phosphate phosphatase [Nitrosomonas sp. Nm51]
MKRLGLVILLVIWGLPGCTGLPPGKGVETHFAGCDDVADRGHLNFLTINLLFSETGTRASRLDAIAEYASNASIDVILLQEVAGGVLVGTANSALDLQGKLRERGHGYDLQTAFETGLPGLLTVANAVLSRCEIDFKMSKRLPKASELEFKGHDIKLPRNIMMTRLKIPEFGLINVYNTHLCAKCSAEELDAQLQALLAFVDETESFYPQANPVILGGDFNIDRFRIDPFGERVFYDNIIGAGFTDAYAEGRFLDNLCANTAFADQHCTVGVSTLDAGDSARRIDYIFVKTLNRILQSNVVFNNLVDESQVGVSDHAGVFISIELP